VNKRPSLLVSIFDWFFTFAPYLYIVLGYFYLVQNDFNGIEIFFLSNSYIILERIASETFILHLIKTAIIDPYILINYKFYEFGSSVLVGTKAFINLFLYNFCILLIVIFLQINNR